MFYISSTIGAAYKVSFPDDPEMMAHGRTLIEAFRNACVTVDNHLEMVEVE
jgi:predicted RNase H-like HicB family nuclease